MPNQTVPTTERPYEVFRGDNSRHPATFSEAPPWRRFDQKSKRALDSQYVIGPQERAAVNAAICLRRPLLITGRPGVGKSSLARAVAHELNLEPLLTWPITSRSNLQQGMYEYDGIARVQTAARWQAKGDTKEAKAAQAIEEFLSLGPLGSALADSTEARPRVLLIDEIDKSDIDLPNDLLHVFEEGEYYIPELARASRAEGRASITVKLYRGAKESKGVAIKEGNLVCRAFPIVFLTSNGEREFPPAFLRRCLRLDIAKPNRAQLEEIIARRLNGQKSLATATPAMLDVFEELQKKGIELSTDQLLNAVHLVCSGHPATERELIDKVIFRALNESGS